MSEADNIALSLRAVAEHEDLTGTSFDIVNEAAATIDKLEKRIGELESAWDQLTKRHAEALTDLAAERQRLEECEAVLRPFARNAAAMWFRNADPETGVETHLCIGADEECLFTIGELKIARDYFAPPSTTEAENE